ncbi:UNVERIFIED_CONTAM: Non-specific lipid-transfer protein 8 [Sesamum radiatum]|uniref:Non-specific lipid-transfer protein n=1 Tax=Sesamum radiatum TaxID=300843 RepID=A0AAW2R2B5_SESRA
MAYSSPAIRLLVTTLIVVLLVAPATAITCSDVIKDLQPCVNYLKSGSGAPPAACCAGASNLASSATTTADKQTACSCLKNAAKNISLKPELAKSLPGNCGISLPFEVSPNVDCSKYCYTTLIF